MRIGMQPFTVQQTGDLLFAQLREKRLPAPEACIGSLPPIGADIRISWVHCT